MSHVILAEKNPDGSVVEKIHQVVSVDAVVFPATTKSFQEQHRPNGEGNSLAANLAWLTSERETLLAQIARLKTELGQLRAVREVDELLDQSLLPVSAVTDFFRGQLLAAPSREDRQALIEERQRLLESFSRVAFAPRSQARLGDPNHSKLSLTDEQLIAAIRRR